MHLVRCSLVALLFVACAPKTKPAAPTRLPALPVDVVTDVNGIPHIYAKNDADLFWGQGYVMAELRPAQSE